MIKKLDHASISTSDINRSLAFYRDVLGLKVEFEDETSGKDFGSVMGASDDFRALVIKFEEGLELIQFISPAGARLDIKPWDIGAVILDFEVSGLEELYSDLKEKGVEFVSPLTSLKAPNAGDDPLKIVQLHGPDGERIVLIESKRR
ncbi:MAG: VOC family protein [Deltaproteobacteria bacterium]|nr:VOC family protein [Deltaproteobacteria bacterium]